MMQKEPAALVGIGTAAVGVALAYGLVDAKEAVAWETLLLALLPVVSGLLTRFLVFSPNTIREAGLNPAEVKADADNPAVPKNCEGA